MRLPWFGLQVEGREFRHADALWRRGGRGHLGCVFRTPSPHTLFTDPHPHTRAHTYTLILERSHSLPAPPRGVQGGAGGVNGCVDTPLAQ